MDQEKILRGLEESIATWNIDDCRKYAEMAMESGIEPDRAINDGLAKGMDRISRGFDRAEVFLPQIMMASKAMEAALEIIEPYMMSNARLKGVVVMGSVKGDIHSIGKNVCCAMLRGAGYRVIDLGPDVSAQDFIDAADENEAQVLGGSALMTTTLEAQRELVQAVKEVEGPYKCIFGGAPCSQEWCDEINADGYSETANEIIGLVDRLTQ